jgi:membrane protease YdiL (CAAX protease family)
VLVPIVEELVFRGVVMRTVSRYYAFWVAVIVQAIVFTIWHEDRSTYFFIFTLALVAAWLARRSGGLLAPIALHATNNAFAALSLLAVSHAIDRLS